MVKSTRSYRLKSLLGTPLAALLRSTSGLRRSLSRLYAHAHLSSQIKPGLPASVVVYSSPEVHGTGAITIGEDCLFFPGLYLETQNAATIQLGDSVVLSRGVHLVAMAGITIGKGSMIGEYASIRDANHSRSPGRPMRDSGFTARPIVLGAEVWIGRGAAILAGVTIGDGATVGANAVVTRDVPPGAVVAGVPARPIQAR